MSQTGRLTTTPLLNISTDISVKFHILEFSLSLYWSPNQVSNDGVSYGKLHLDKIKECSKNTVNLTEHKRQDGSVFAEATEARRRWSRQRTRFVCGEAVNLCVAINSYKKTHKNI